VALNTDDANVLSYLRRCGGEAVLVALNMSGARQTIRIDLAAHGLPSAGWATLLATSPAPRSPSNPEELTLQPFSVYIAATRD
jgi:hypothetical protein